MNDNVDDSNNNNNNKKDQQVQSVTLALLSASSKLQQITVLQVVTISRKINIHQNNDLANIQGIYRFIDFKGVLISMCTSAHCLINLLFVRYCIFGLAFHFNLLLLFCFCFR